MVVARVEAVMEEGGKVAGMVAVRVVVMEEASRGAVAMARRRARKRESLQG